MQHHNSVTLGVAESVRRTDAAAAWKITFCSASSWTNLHLCDSHFNDGGELSGCCDSGYRGLCWAAVRGLRVGKHYSTCGVKPVNTVCSFYHPND